MAVIRNKIYFHHLASFSVGAAGMSWMWLVKGCQCRNRLAVGFLAFYSVGNFIFKKVNLHRPWGLQQHYDPEIWQAQQQQYVVKAFNTSGYGDISLTLKQNTRDGYNIYNKPY